MKKTTLFLLAAALVFSACSTTVPLKENTEINPLAVVTINGNGEMAWNDEPSESTTGGKLLGLVKDIASTKDDKVSNMIYDGTEDLLALAAEEVTAVLTESDRPVIDKEKVLASKAYARARDSRNDHPDFIVADDYKYIVTDGHELNSMLKEELGVNGSLYIQFDFMKTMLNGAMESGELGAYVFLKYFIIDSEGKYIYGDSFYAESRDGIPVLARMYDADELHKLFPPLIEEVCWQFAMEL